MSNEITLPAAERALALVADGMSLTRALDVVGLTWGKFSRQCDVDDQLASSYARATRLRADRHAEEVVDIADTEVNPQVARNRMDARRWFASKMNPSKFSDRIDINVTQTVDLNAAMAAADARLRPVSDQHSDVTDLVADESGTYKSRPTDETSGPALPSIFD